MIDYTIKTLDNGLRVIHNYDPARAMVALNLLYNVGARDEKPEHTGLAHLFEHLMFGGSANVPDYSREIQRAGGTDNAWTSNDFTNFYCKVPAENAEAAFRAESDRMLALSADPKVLDVQRRVVVEEFKQQCLNQPYGDLMHKLRPAVYGSEHPYSWPTIGKEYSHVEQTTPADVDNWFYTHYAPNNAVLAVSGNITLEETMRLARKWFGTIPAREIAHRQLPAPQLPAENVRLELNGKVPATLLVKAYPMAAYGQPGYYAADMITDLLSNGQSSRFVQRLMLADDSVFAGVDASITGCEHEGMMLILAQMADESPETLAKAEQLIERELMALTRRGEVSEYELERAKNRFEFTHAKQMNNYMDRARELALATLRGFDLNDRVARQRAVTLDDIQRTATRLFVERPHVTVVYRPEQG